MSYLTDPASWLVVAVTIALVCVCILMHFESLRICMRYLPPPTERRRLVMDIGGGSTEFIIGEGFEALERESLQMGCVATTKRFFDNGKLSRKRWNDARTEIAAEFQQFASLYRARGSAPRAPSRPSARSRRR